VTDLEAAGALLLLHVTVKTLGYDVKGQMCGSVSQLAHRDESCADTRLPTLPKKNIRQLALQNQNL
jgi:hypothetical protein